LLKESQKNLQEYPDNVRNLPLQENVKDRVESDDDEDTG
jgi:hypothetical protein